MHSFALAFTMIIAIANLIAENDMIKNAGGLGTASLEEEGNAEEEQWRGYTASASCIWQGRSA